MGTSKLPGMSDEMLEHKGPIQVISNNTRGLFMLHGNWDKPRLGGSIGLSTNFLIAK